MTSKPSTSNSIVTVERPKAVDGRIDDSKYQKSKETGIKSLFKKKSMEPTISSLTEIIDPTQDLKKFEQEGLEGLDPQKIYHHNWFRNVFSGNALALPLINRVFSKLPNTLGREIESMWKQYLTTLTEEELSQMTIHKAVIFISDVLEKKCTELKTKSELKGQPYCEDIWTAQQYDRDPHRPKYVKPIKKRKPTSHTSAPKNPRSSSGRGRGRGRGRKGTTVRAPKEKKEEVKAITQGESQAAYDYNPRITRRYGMRRSNARSPYLDKSKHVKKYNPERDTYKPPRCFSCSVDGHVSLLQSSSTMESFSITSPSHRRGFLFMATPSCLQSISCPWFPLLHAKASIKARVAA